MIVPLCGPQHHLIGQCVHREATGEKEQLGCHPIEKHKW